MTEQDLLLPSERLSAFERELLMEENVRGLKDLLFCWSMGHAAELKAESAAIAEIHTIEGMRDPYWSRKSDSPEARYVRRSAEKAWDNAFEKTRKMIDFVMMEKVARNIGALGVEALDQYDDGLITKRELVSFLIDRIATNLGPEKRLEIGLMYNPEKPKKMGVEL